MNNMLYFLYGTEFKIIMSLFYSFIPEIFLSFALILLLLFHNIFAPINPFHWENPDLEESFNQDLHLNKELPYQILFILLCLLLLYSNLKIECSFFNPLFISHKNLCLAKMLCVCVYLIPAITSLYLYENEALQFFSWFLLMPASLLILLLLLSFPNMLYAYWLIEFLPALFSYVSFLEHYKIQLTYHEDEAEIYSVSSSFLSGIFYLFGCFLLYSLLGTLNFNSLYILLEAPLDFNNFSYVFILCLSVILITGTLLLKLFTAPFRFWGSDAISGCDKSTRVIFFVLLPRLAILYFILCWSFILFNSLIYFKILLLIISLFVAYFLDSMFSDYKIRINMFPKTWIILTWSVNFLRLLMTFFFIFIITDLAIIIFYY